MNPLGRIGLQFCFRRAGIRITRHVSGVLWVCLHDGPVGVRVPNKGLGRWRSRGLQFRFLFLVYGVWKLRLEFRFLASRFRSMG